MILLPERPDPAYAQLVVNVDDTSAVQNLMEATSQLIETEFPETHPYGQTPGIHRRYCQQNRGSLLWPRPRRARGSSLTERMQLYVDHGLVDRKIDWREQRLSLRRSSRMNLVHAAREFSYQTLPGRWHQAR